MKSTFLLSVMLIAFSFANAQKLKEADVLQPVKAKFQKLYPKVQSAVWGKEGSDFEAEFKNNGEETSVVIDATGNLKETEVEMEVAKLLKSITDYCTANFKDYKISEAAKTIDSKNVTTYEAELKNGKDKFDAIFDAQGKFIKKVAE